MEKKYFKTSFTSDKFEKVNEEFLKCTISVCTHEQIANGTNFTKESLDNALPTLNYLPVVGYFKDENFQDHGVELTIDDEGIHETIKTVPFGVVIKDSYRYENLTKDNGETEEYLVCDAYLWSRYQEAISVIKDNDCSQSMEVNITNGSLKDNYYEISEFSFSALCILGTAIPAFNLAKIRTSDKFSKDEFKVNYSEMIGALNNFLDFSKGGDKVEDEKRQEIINKFTTLKGENFENIINNKELTLEELESQLFSLSTNDLERKIRESLLEHKHVHTDWWGDTYECQKYYLDDVLTTEGIAICEDSECWYNYYGIPYAVEGDIVSLDIENAKRYIRGDWREFQEGEKELVSNIFEVEIKHNKEKAEEVNSNFTESKEELKNLKCDFTDLNEKYSIVEKDNVRLVEFESKIIKEQKDGELNSIFEEFSDLKNATGYSEIFEKRYELSSEELIKEMKVLAFDNQDLLTKKIKQNFSRETIKVPVHINSGSEELTEAEKRYGKGIKKYLNK